MLQASIDNPEVARLVKLGGTLTISIQAIMEG
jgi:hypothetical protein